jgi:hypothetical protein
MSAVWLKQYMGMVDRGTTTLSGIDAAETKKLLTAAEAAQVRQHYHDTYDIVGLNATVDADRRTSVTWNAPSTGSGSVRVALDAGGQQMTLDAAPTAREVLFDAPTDPAQVEATVTAVVVIPASGYTGDTVTTSTTVPAAPAAEEPPAS